MDSNLVDECAKALWDKYISDPAHQYKIFKKYGRVTWRQLNEIDIVPNLAQKFRDSAKVSIIAMRRYIASNSCDPQSMLDLFITATTNGD